MSTLRGKAKLRHWVELFRNNEVLLGAVTERMAKRTLGLVARGFRDEKDPYGVPWAPKKRPDGRKILHGPTGQLRKFRALRVAPRLFLVEPGADYASVHQAPKRGQTARMMVPSTDRGLPDDWRKSLSRAAISAMRNHFEPKPESPDPEDSTGE